MPHIVVNARISEGPAYASFNLGQCLNVALLDLVAAVVSLLTSCNIQANQILKENVNYCLLNFIVSLAF